MRTAPPNDAGIATPNSSPARPCDSATPGERGERHRPAGRDPVSVLAAHRYPRPNRRTSPSNPPSATRMFDPLPMTTTGMPVSRTASPAATRSRSDSGSRYRAAGPPIRNDVRGERGNSVRTRSPQAARRIDSARREGVRARCRAGLTPLPDRSSAVAEHRDVAGTHREDEVALAHLRHQEPDDVLSVRQVRQPVARGRRRRAAHHQLARDPWDRILAGAVHVGHHDEVHSREALAELSPQRLGPRVPMRLEHSHQPAMPDRRALRASSRARWGHARSRRRTPRLAPSPGTRNADARP